MKTAFLIFPHQLFKIVPTLSENTTVYLIEEFLFFDHYNFHKAKLSFHRASMKAYQDYLASENLKPVYVETKAAISDVRKLIKKLATENFSEIKYSVVHDNWLQKRLDESCEKYKLKNTAVPSPYFLNSLEELNEWKQNNKKYFHHKFYQDQRKKHRIMVDAKDQPAGGQWSYDEENRKKIPAKHTVNKIAPLIENKYYKEAVNYIEKHFEKNYGECNVMRYPTTFLEAEQWLEIFLKDRFTLFGDYEDALVNNNHQLYHSLLSPLMNVGLLTPKYVIDQALKFADKHQIPINSVEGFVRQIIGWREFMNMVYFQIGNEQRTRNFWNFKRKLPASFWDGTTGIEPIDVIIKEILKTGYCHHIERLMVLGNFMLLCEFDPDDVYRWFMEMFIDSYDWVMVPNVYGMSQYADGGLTTTKPYVSGSNYIIKMSNYKKGEWSEIWDSLFWRFMDVHRTVMGKNMRIGMLIKSFDKMPQEKRERYHEVSDKFFANLK